MSQTKQQYISFIYLVLQLTLIISTLILTPTFSADELNGNSPIILPKEDTIDYTYPFPPEDTAFFFLSTDSSDKNLPDGLDIINTYFTFDSEYFYFKLETKGKINTAGVIPYYYGIDITTEEKAVKLKRNYYSFYFCSGCKQEFKTFEGAPESGYITYGKKYIFGEQIVIGQEFIHSEKDRIRAEPIEIYANKNTLYFKIDRYIFKGKPNRYSVRFFTIFYEEIQRQRQVGPLQYESFTTYFSRYADSLPITYIYSRKEVSK